MIFLLVSIPWNAVSHCFCRVDWCVQMPREKLFRCASFAIASHQHSMWLSVNGGRA